MELRRWRLKLGNGLRLGQRRLELRHGRLERSWSLGGRRLKASSSSSRVYRVLAALFGSERPPEARQKLAKRVLINRSNRYLRAGRRECSKSEEKEQQSRDGEKKDQNSMILKT